MNALLALVPPGGHVGFLDNLSYQLAGLAVVILSLSLLSVVVSIAGRFLRVRKPKPASPPPASAPAPTEGLPPELIAVITAAVAVTLRSPHRIVQIRASDNPWLHAWASEGRRQIFQSHRVR